MMEATPTAETAPTAQPARTAPTAPVASGAAGLAESVLAQARRTPGAVAVIDGERHLDYAALDSASATVADALRRRGIRPGQAVAVCLPRSWQLVCAMLGVLRLGAVVVPLDAQSPPERRGHILTDAATVALIHGETAPEDLPGRVAPLAVAALLETAPATADVPPRAATAAAPVSFVFYTSGTTGRPKGVEVRDAGILRLARPGWIELPEGARYACLSNPAFDALSFEVWVPLLTGGCCVILDDEVVQTPDVLAAELLRRRIDTLFMTVALFNTVVDRAPDCFTGVRRVLVGGEQLNAPLIRRWYRDNPAAPTRLHNVYGPTEATTFALCHPIPRDAGRDVVPIGRTLPGTEALVVADGARPAGTGELGELLLAGEALAAGYRNLPDETARRFVRLPWHDGGRARYHRTGDLVRRGADGLIEYVGRADRQVKVRGFRIEPGELERHILSHPAVRQTYVCTRRDETQGVNELLAFLVPGAGLTFDDFDRHLAAGLPPYMRPHRIHLVGELPLNANGKVDQAALLRRDDDEPWRRAEATAPEAAATEWQRGILELAGQVLGVPGLRLDDRWIASGGDSLKALRLRFEVRRRWGCELPQRLVLRADLAELAAAVRAGRATDHSPYPAAPAPGDARSAPATSEQQRLWLLHQQDPRSSAYNVGLSFRIRGTVDSAALRRALQRLVARHPAPRTAFEATAGGLRQVVGEPYDPWTEPPADLGGDEKSRRDHADRFFATPFDLTRPRLLRASWLAEDDGGALLLHLHHIAVDGWSLNVLLRELSQEYAAVSHGDGAAPPAAPTPLDFAAWQTDWFSRPGYLTQRAELRAHYDAAEQEKEHAAMAAPPEPVRRAAREGRLLRTSLDAVRRTTLDRLCSELGLTRFQLLLGVFAWSLYGVTGRSRLRVASPVANRPVQAFEASVGMFANTVLLPTRVEPRRSLRAELLRHGTAAQAVLDRQDVALADVLADRDAGAGGTPFDFLFVLENTDFSALALPGCDTRPEWSAPAHAKCPLTLSVVEHEDGFDCLWEYAEGHFTAPEVQATADLFRSGLDRLAEDRDTTVAHLVAPYRQSLPDPGRGTPAEPACATVAEAFARQVRRTPTAPALAAGDRTLSYALLDVHAAALAAELLERFPVPPEDDRPRSIALHLEPSVEHVVALLALARLNITVVPLDPAYPPAVLRQILDQAEPLCVLVPPGGEAALDAIAPPDLHRSPVTLSTAPAPALPPHEGRRPLYTLFTSGSTGTPKGVQVSDRTLCNLLQWQSESGGLSAPAVTQQFSMLSFDVSFQEIFGTLCGGGCLHLARPGWRQDAPALLAQLESAGVERVFMPYVALQLLAEHAVHLGRYPSRLREVITAGEQLLCTDAIRRWFAGMPGARLFNHYGPTETHVVSALRLDGDPAHWPERPAIGLPVANARLRVVDEADQVVPPGCPGRLLIGGPMVARCYLGDAELNRSRFVELPGAGLFYRTGDQARFDHEGLLHYLGRDDQQIKLSGHRLELGQVEAALLRHPAIVNAVVVLDGDQLAACLQCRDECPSPEELASHLAPLLPPHARIHRFRLLETLPRTPSGKLDRRRALAAPGKELNPRPAPAPRLSPLEVRLTALFEAVTGTPVQPDQRFFDAGASSLDLMRFHLRCTTEHRLPLTIPDLFEHVTIRRLARFLEGRPATAGLPTAAPATVPGTPAADEPVAVVGMAVRLPGADDLASFWEMVRSGRRGTEHFDAADGLVGARSQMAGLLAFDPEHFGISRRDARLMDPQQRHLLMACVQALAHAGVADPAGRHIGLVASCGENTYFQSMLREADPADLPDDFQLALHHDKDFLATKAAYHLGLTGPAFTVQAACASSLVAVHLAAGLLRQGDAEVMLAGGVLADPRLTDGYTYQPQHIFSRDGHCRPFSDDADGTIGASGVGVVVLKPLRLAQRDGDTVHAVITGSAVNNDGAGKLGYSAPSLAGQREVIRAALRRAGRSGADVGYVEAHGTGTQLGDPVEVGALRQALDLGATDSCALTSVKSQIGHLGAAAGVVGLVRAALAVRHGVIPPNVGFRRVNPRIGDVTPFHIPADARPWPADRPRVAAVSSFGIGGTNAHLLLEQGQTPATPPTAPPCLMLSASSAESLRTDASRIADYLQARPEAYDQVLRHLQAGRPPHRWRTAAVCPDAAAAVAWLRTAAGVEAAPGEGSLAAADRTAQELADAWLAGRTIHWPAGPAQAPWDFPPPAFRLTDHDFERAASASGPAAPDGWPQRLPEAEWLHQPHWVRLRRALPAGPDTPTRGLLVVMTAEPLPEAAVRPLRAAYSRVVRVGAADAFAQLADDLYQVDPADPDSLDRLLDALADEARTGVDWLHALPLSVDGPVGEESLTRARWACLDTPAALIRALAGRTDTGPLRTLWLSHRAQPVEGDVDRPELGLLAGACEVAPQESAVAGRWLDLPGAGLADWAPLLAPVLAEPQPSAPEQRRLALRQGYWWQPTLLPVTAAPADAPAALIADHGVHLILGGTGGIGGTIAAWLLERTDCRVILVARRPSLPAGLAPWADRVQMVEADLAEQPPQAVLALIERYADRLDGVVHAAGVAAGSLIVRRDAAEMRRVTAAKLNGALLVESLIQRHRPAFAVYCSSMAALYGGVGQLDYAAAGGLLDGFARHRATPAETTLRLGIDWDIWKEVGMAREALRSDARHQAHLATGLGVAEGRRVFERALRLQLPHLLVSTTAPAQTRCFYEAPAGASVPAPEEAVARHAETARPAERLAEHLCRWLGVEELDPDASLYDLGADSLTLLDLISEVKRLFGIDLELSRLSHRVSLTEVLTRLGASAHPGPESGEQVPVEVWQEGEGRDLLCLVHPVGGDIQAYRALVSSLDPRLTVCLIADPALRRPGPEWPVEERARHYHAALRQRFPHGEWRLHLAGWSFGAWVALAMAAEAEAVGRPADGLFLIDPPPPGSGRRLRDYDEAHIEAVFAHELGTTADAAAGGAKDYAERLARRCRANLAGMARYEPPRLSGTPSRLWLAARPVAGLSTPGSPRGAATPVAGTPAPAGALPGAGHRPLRHRPAAPGGDGGRGDQRGLVVRPRKSLTHPPRKKPETTAVQPKDTPYQSLPPRSFWRSAVAEPDPSAIADLWTPTSSLGQDEPVLTAGSCFARHIGPALLGRGMNWRDTEPAPPGLTQAERRSRQYGVFSFRTGNIYTAATLRQWLSWAQGESAPPDEVWCADGGFFDPFRPSVEPEGYDSAEAMLAARRTTLDAISGALAAAGCLIFTLGLTEAWENRSTGAVYPVCPGTVRGTFDPAHHVFRNFTFSEVYRDLSAALALARAANPALRVVLTVSPVPLTATATGGHALTATTYSKSVLRAVAGQLAQEHDHIDYFPAYEIITGFPFKAAFFEPNLRTVTPDGIAFAMRHFFGAVVRRPGEPRPGPGAGSHHGEDVWCDDAVLDYYNPR
ncbi:GSCFA domain-containing protein [Streptomyces dangxiongensis]|uniref:GSCFA domain-containing protein n=1 Tax=Streptomyces dangxiongensis TaxID=1442032 RepID=UPI0030B83A01